MPANARRVVAGIRVTARRLGMHHGCLRRASWAPAGVRGALTPPAGEEGKEGDSPRLAPYRGLCESLRGTSPRPFITKSEASGGHTPVTIETGTIWTTPGFIRRDEAVGPLLQRWRGHG